MCNCVQNVIKKIEEEGFEGVSAPTGLLTGKIYIEFIGKKKGQKKLRKIPVQLAICPFCGKEYEIDKGKLLNAYG